jgi:hypothetical protein
MEGQDENLEKGNLVLVMTLPNDIFAAPAKLHRFRALQWQTEVPAVQVTRLEHAARAEYLGGADGSLKQK